jgi:hypothetical protein
MDDRKNLLIAKALAVKKRLIRSTVFQLRIFLREKAGGFNENKKAETFCI